MRERRLRICSRVSCRPIGGRPVFLFFHVLRFHFGFLALRPPSRRLGQSVPAIAPSAVAWFRSGAHHRRHANRCLHYPAPRRSALVTREWEQQFDLSRFKNQIPGAWSAHGCDSSRPRTARYRRQNCTSGNRRLWKLDELTTKRLKAVDRESSASSELSRAGSSFLILRHAQSKAGL
jgi:hypothetical protein